MKLFKFRKSFFAIFFLIFAILSKETLAWSGYDYDNKTDVYIGPGNLVREGNVFQFYDSKSDDYHDAKVLFINDVAGGTQLEIEDITTKEERVFLMEN